MAAGFYRTTIKIEMEKVAFKIGAETSGKPCLFWILHGLDEFLRTTTLSCTECTEI